MIKKIFICGLTLCVMFLSCVFSACGNGLRFYKYDDVVFSLSMSFWAEIAGKNAKKAYEEMLEVLEEINLQTNINSTTTYKKQDGALQAASFESDILRFNRMGTNQEIKLGTHSYNLIKLAQEIYQDESAQKSFNAAIYPLSYLWGVDALNVGLNGFNKSPPPSFVDGYPTSIEATVHPSLPQIESIKELCDLSNLTVTKRDDGYYASKTKEGLMLDLGGLAKGYALDMCKQICIDNDIDVAFIELGGQVLTYKKDHIDYDWTMIVRKPQKTQLVVEYICGFETNQSVSVATSGDYERYRSLFSDPNNQNIGQELIDTCHIIDSKRGIPYDTFIDEEGLYKNFDNHIVSCTVITKDAALADAYSTIACVLGIEKAIELFESKNIQSVMFTKDNKMAITGGLVLIEEYQELLGFKDYELINN